MANYSKPGRFGNRLRRLSTENLSTLFDLFTKSAGDYLDGWFEGELLKAWLGFDAIVGNYASPYTPGTAYVLLHHAFGEVNGKKRVWGHAIGGMGAITQAMARAATGHGVEIETDAPVREVLIEKGGPPASFSRTDGWCAPRRSPPTSTRSCSTPRWFRSKRSIQPFCAACARGAAAPGPSA